MTEISITSDQVTVFATVCTCGPEGNCPAERDFTSFKTLGGPYRGRTDYLYYAIVALCQVS